MARKTYTESFKRDAIRLMTEKGYSLSKASQALGVSQQTLSNWKKTLVPREQHDLEKENRRLREENRRLRMEREISKRAATYFAKESRMRYAFIEDHRDR
jgi:transposase